MTPQIPDPETLWLVMPEIWLIIGMCAVILVPFINRSSSVLPIAAAAVGLGLSLVSTLSTCASIGSPDQVIFNGMLTIDPFSQFFKAMLLLFTLLVMLQWITSTRRETGVYDIPDFLCLLLGATLGMAMMSSASNLLMIFIATESASMPSFVLAGFRKGQRVGSEGALKYVIFGTASSAIMLYGMSLVYGTTGSLDLSAVAAAAGNDISPLMGIGLLAMFAGIAFKLSAVPLHFWCPDVFEGAPIPVTTFLSFASKGAAVCMLLRVLHAFGVSAAGSGPGSEIAFTGIAVGIGIMGAITATWGNLVALHQTRIKRLLAYSSIAHAGYMIMTASVLVLAEPGDPTRAVTGAILFYLLVYLFMNLGAFTIAGWIAAQTGDEDIRDYAGLIHRSPVLMVLLSLFLLSLFGMPGLGGFSGKIFLMASISQAGGAAGYALIAVLLLNTLISLYYYMRPVYFMVFVPDLQARPGIATRPATLGLLALCALMLLWTGVLPSSVRNMTQDHGEMISGHTQRISVLPDPTTPPLHRSGEHTDDDVQLHRTARR